MIFEGLGCLVLEGRAELADLANQYLTLFNECLKTVEGCFYHGDTNSFGCTCSMDYFYYIKPLNMKKKECKNVSQSDFEDFIGPAFVEHNENIMNLTAESFRCFSSISPRKILPFEKLDLSTKSIESRRFEPFKVCTCDSDKCDPTKQGPAMTSTVVPEDTTKPNGGGSNKPNGGGNGQGDVSNKPNGGGNGQGAGSNNDKKTTKQSSAKMNVPSLVIMLIIAVTIALIFDRLL